MRRFAAIALVLLTLLALSACTEKVDEYPIAWEYVTGLPEGFPQLCDKITTTNENYSPDETDIELSWSRVSKADFDSYKAKIEEWASAKFGEQDEQNIATLVATVNGEKLTVQAIYNPDASGNHIQGAMYECQGRIIVKYGR